MSLNKVMFLFFFLFFLTPADWQMQNSMMLSKQNSFEQSEKVMKLIKLHEVDRDLYFFYRLLNNFCMNEQKEALFYSEQVNDINLPERYKVLTALMRMDMEHWKKDDIEDIARDMKHVKNRLENTDLGKKTIKIQDSIVKRLDKMIDELENPPKENSSESSSKQNQKKEPLKDSVIENTGGTGEVLSTKMRKLQEKWGSLPPREKTLALQELTQGMSLRHRQIIENYFKNLATNENRNR